MDADTTLFLFLPAEADGPLLWARAEGGRITGEGPDWQGDAGVACVIAIAPVRDMGVAQVDLPDLAPAQAAAAARLALADRIALGGQAVHLVAEGGRAVWLPVAQMEAWLARLGTRPEHIIPAAALFTPQQGAFRFSTGVETLVVTAGAVWADEPTLTAAMAPEGVEDVSPERVAAALLSAADAPSLDLLSGAYGPKRSWGFAAPAWKRAALLTGALLGVSLMIPLAQAWSVHRSAAKLEREAEALARKAFPGTPDPLMALATKGATRGQFTRHYAMVAEVIAATPGSELGTLTLRPDGTLDVAVRAPDRAALQSIATRIGAQGMAVVVGAEATVQGKVSANMQVTG